MNEEERKKLIDGIKAAITEKLKAAGADDGVITGLLGRLAAMEQALAERGAILPALRGNGPNPFGTAEFASRLKLLNDGQPTTGRIALKGVGPKSLRALISIPELGGTTGFPTLPERGPTIPPPTPPLTLVDLLRSAPVVSDSWEFVQLHRTSEAGVQQNQGDLKPNTDVGATLATAKIATIAHWTQAAKQVLGDNSQLSTMLALLLGIDVKAKYESLIINGNGTTDKILGLVPQATVFSHTQPHPVDRISEAIASMWMLGYTASAVVINAQDWSDIEVERAVTGDGQYLSSGGWATPNAPTVWRLPVAKSASLAQGTALVIDQSRVLLLDREQANVAVSSEDRDNFIRNVVTLLAEMRAGMAVLDVGGVVKVDLGST